MSEGATQAPARAFWERMERQRASLGWTKTKLYEEVRAKLEQSPREGGRAGFSRVTLDRLKTQPNPPLASTVNAIAELLRIPLTEAHLLAGILDASEARTQPQGIAVSDVGDDPETAALLAQLPPKRRAELEKARERERKRLRRLQEHAEREVRIAREEFADLVRNELGQSDNGEQ